MPVPDPWFSRVIAEGLQRLAAMHLVGTPTDAGLDLACAVWIDTLWYRRAWHQDPDAARLRRAFAALSGSARRWPAPAELLDHLPARPQPLALPKPDRTPVGQAHLAVMKRLIARALKPLPGTTPRSKQP